MGAKTDPRFLVPSLIHDVLCENHDYIDNDRYLSSVVFERLLYVSNVNPVSRCLLKCILGESLGLFTDMKKVTLYPIYQ